MVHLKIIGKVHGYTELYSARCLTIATYLISFLASVKASDGFHFKWLIKL